MGAGPSLPEPSSSVVGELVRGDDTAGGLPPGTMLGKSYRLEELIGRGGVGSVYRATHLSLRREFAVKIVRASDEHEARSALRLVQEARIASSLGSDHIIDVTDLGHTSEGLVYVVMELLAGEDLAARIAREGGPLPDALVRRVFAEILEGLGEAHAAGVVHRDMKPANVFLATRGDRTVSKILDFGLSKVSVGSDDPRLTRTGQIIGTPLYMSPEQARSAPTDARADIYSLGVMLYEALTGRPPLEAGSALECVLKHATEAPRPIGEHRPDLPPGVRTFVHDCLEKDPEARPASAEELRERWERAWREDAGAEAGSARRWRAGAALAAILVGIGGAGWLLTDTGDANRRSHTSSSPSAPPADPMEEMSRPPPTEAPPRQRSEQANQPLEEPRAEGRERLSVRIDSTPSGAEIFRDGQRLGTTPFDLPVDPSSEPATLVLRHPGHRPARVVVDPSEPTPAVIALERRPRLRRAAPSLAPRYGED